MDGHYVFKQMSLEWAVVGTSTRARRALHQWAQRYPRLSGYASPFALTQARRSLLQGGDRDAILDALVELAPSDDLAARAAVEALTPGLWQLARRYSRTDSRLVGPGRAWRSVDELEHDVVAFAAARLRAGGAAGRPWPAGRILDGVRWDLNRTAGEHARAIGSDVEALDDRDLASDDRDAHAAERLATLLVEAVSSRVLSRDVAGLIYTTGVLGHGTPVVGAATGENCMVLRQRRSRGVRRLAEAVATGRLRKAS